MKKNLYRHKIELVNLKIINRPREEFAKLLENINYRGYQVEDLSDGRKIVITKPGGKFTFGKIKRDDFMVWIYNPTDLTLWLITHKNVNDDLEEKAKTNPVKTLEILNVLEQVYNGEEPDSILSKANLSTPCGESPELLIKAYKWIWGQEDCNYPEGKGRAMSWEGWKKVDDTWVKTGKGLCDLRDRLKAQLKQG
ncbi:MAG: hypothetical protein AAB332_03150 [Planctomycetota bacterium]